MNVELGLKQAGCDFYDISGVAEFLCIKPATFLTHIKKNGIGSPFRKYQRISNRNTIIYSRGECRFPFFVGTLKRPGCSIQNRALLLLVIQCNIGGKSWLYLRLG